VAGSSHRLPRARVVDRADRILELACGRRVIDIGFVDEGRMLVKRETGLWLHAELARVAHTLVGIDFDEEGVAAARQLGYEAYRADCQSGAEVAALGLAPAEVVVAGELVEHLDRPGDFLEAVRGLLEPGGRLVLTTPNGLSLTNFLGALAGRELVNPDHVAWLSPRTITTLLGRHGWQLEELAYYRFPSVRDSAASGRVTRGQAAAFTAYQQLARPLFLALPWLSDGLVAVATR
jgi:2-polyprenyl-3-methyl-5-hydroxy-6-metoxy-1,4-benzoquinol methylase